jgi:membrane protease YdiL (CAAX protease family)
MEYSNKDSESVYAIPQKSTQWLASIFLFLHKIIKSLPVFLLLSVALIILAMLFPIFYTTFIGSYNSNTDGALILYDCYCAFIYLVIPVGATKYIFTDTLTDLGWKTPAKPGHAIIFTTIALAILIPYICLFAQQTNFRHFYSVHDSSFTKLFFVNMVIFPPYYFVEEFFFRGFLFLYLWKKVRWHSFWITDILFTFSHLGKPGLEILLCIPASVVFNCLTLATRSFYPAFFVHFTLGTVLFLIVNLNLLA